MKLWEKEEMDLWRAIRKSTNSEESVRFVKKNEYGLLQIWTQRLTNFLYLIFAFTL